MHGIAGIAQAQVGDLVGTASGTLLTTVSTVDPIKVIFPVSESDYLEAVARIQETMNEVLQRIASSDRQGVLAEPEHFVEAQRRAA